MSAAEGDMADRFRGTLLGCLLGDAFGSILEGMSASDPRLEARISRRRVERLPWRYTDDTEMALGVARSLVACGGLNEAHLMDTWSDAYEPARGYGKGMKLAIQAWRAGSSPAEAAWRDGSNGNGAAVRVVAAACLFHHDLLALDTAARQTAALTHRGPMGIEGCLLQARALAAALRLPQDSALDATEFLATFDWPAALAGNVGKIPALLGMPLDVAVAELGNGVTADESVPLALVAFLRGQPSFEEVVITAARCGGDVDTIAAMAGALAGAFVGAGKLLPLWLENAEGVEDAMGLADGLFALWRSGSAG